MFENNKWSPWSLKNLSFTSLKKHYGSTEFCNPIELCAQDGVVDQNFLYRLWHHIRSLSTRIRRFESHHAHYTYRYWTIALYGLFFLAGKNVNQVFTHQCILIIILLFCSVSNKLSVGVCLYFAKHHNFCCRVQ